MYFDITETRESKSIREQKKFKRLASMFDGIIGISEGILSYFAYLGDRAHLFLLPVCIDTDRFDEIRTTTSDLYFAYCSGMNLERDGFIDTLNGFLLFHHNYPQYKLKVATGFNKNDEYHKKAWEIITSNSDCIEYIGMLPSYDIPTFLKKSKALLVTPHHNYVTRGFPTKLGEYLASNVPVICSSIDDLKENIPNDCVYMVPPNSPNDICKSLESIVNDPEKAKQTAEKGRMFLEENFTVNAYLSKLMSFLQI